MRNNGFVSFDDHQYEVKQAYKYGYWTGGFLTSMVWLSIILATLYYLGATN